MDKAVDRHAPHGGDATDAGAPVLRVRNVSYNYGSKQALDDVSFEVAQGRFTALLGPNGAGKTTLFSLITRLFDTRNGTIEIAGRSLRKTGSAALEPLGVVFQQPTLDLDLSVKQNLRYFGRLRGMGIREIDRRMERALTALDMFERRKEKVRSLNGGHRRRVEIARAILHDPKLLVLDEPTVGLDVPSRRAIVSHIHHLAEDEGIAALWTTHLIDEIKPTDDLIVLAGGKIVTTGVTRDVVAQSGMDNLDDAFSKLTGAKTAEERIDLENEQVPAAPPALDDVAP